MSVKYNDEINLIELFRKVYRSKKLVIYTTIIFLFAGIISSLLAPIKYSSSTTFIPQNQESTNSSLSGVASLVGINLNSSSYGGEISLSMYPKIGDSPKFKRLILNNSIDIKGSKTLKAYILENYNIEDENIKNKSSIFVSKMEDKCFKILSKILSINVNQKDGFVTISATMSSAEYVAILANNAKEILQQIIIKNRIEKAKENLKFSQEQLQEKRIEFNEIQTKLSYFKDSNLNLVNSSKIDERSKLEAEFQIINAVVTELSKQVEQAKLQVRKDTPVFSTIKEAVIPVERTNPKRKQMVIIFGFIGFIISIFFIILKQPTQSLIKEIKK